MINTLRRLRRLTPADCWLMVRVGVVASILPVVVRLCSVPSLLRLCALRAPRPPAEEALVVTCVDRVLARHPGLRRNPCLRRTLLLYRFLGARATDLEVCLGVRYTDAEPRDRRRRLAGHAWLIRHDAPYLEPDRRGVDPFRVIYRYPTRQGRTA
jgi:hypothetical protein